MTAQSAEISVPYLEKRLKSKPDSRAFSRLADAYRRRGDLRQAIDLCIEGLAKHPDYITARLVLGRCYLEQKNHSAAAGELKKVCIADRRNHAALMMLAEIFVQQGQEDLAGNLYQILLAMEPENTRIRQLASHYVSPSRKKLFELLEISSPDLASSLQNLKSSGVDELADIQNLDTIQSDASPSSQQADDAEPTAQDVEERLDLLFNEESKPEQKYDEAESGVDFETAGDSADDSSDTAVSGSDVSSRLDELFGDESGEDSDPFSLNSAETIQMNRDELIQNTPEVDLPAPENQFEAETAGNQLFDFDAGETIQIDRTELGAAMQKSESSSQSSEESDPLALQPESELLEKTVAWDSGDYKPAEEDRQNESDEIQGYEDGIDTVQAEQDQSPSGEDIIETLDNIFGEETDSKNAAAQPEDNESVSQIDASDQNENVSGSDIENRLEELFPGAEEKEGDSAVQQQNPQDQQDGDFFEIEDVSKPDESVKDEVSGADIEDRLTDLFSDDSDDEVMDQVEDMNSEEGRISDSAVDFENAVDEDDGQTGDAATFDSDSNVKITGTDIEEQLDELFPQEDNIESISPQENSPESEAAESIASDEDGGFPIEKSSESEDKVTGADIEEQLDQLFPQEKSPADVTEEENRSEVTSPNESEGTEYGHEEISGTDIEEKLDQLFPQEQEAEDTPSQDRINLESADEEDIIETIQLDRGDTPSDEESDNEKVDGTDVEKKLDQIFSQNNAEPGKDKEDITETIQLDQGDTVSGTDVEEKLDQIFSQDKADVSESNVSPKPERDITETIRLDQVEASFTDENVSGTDVEKKLEQMFPQTETDSTENSAFDPEDKEDSADTPHDKEVSGKDDKVTGEDIEDKLDQLFPRSEQKKDSDSISEEMEEMPELGSEDLSTTTEEENVSGDDVQDRIRELFTSEESSDNKRIASSQNSGEFEEEIDERDEPFSLPDHVLTPTLADIYFQQGQPKLALQIYERLAQRDPDDSSIQSKIVEIRDSIEHSDTEQNAPTVKDIPEEKPSEPKKRTSSGKKRKRKTDKDSRPLAGVRIKKKPRRSK